MKKEDLIGLKFNMLSVISNAEDRIDKNGRRTPCVLCRCDCGKEVTVVKSSVKSGHTKSCGCIKNKKEDLSNQRFGRFLVLHRDKDKNRYWICKCDCGNIKSVLSSNLKSGKSISCGCYRNEAISNNLRINISGFVFGRLTVIKRDRNTISKNGTTITNWLCRCECGNLKVVKTKSLISGNTTSCGCYKRELTSNILSSKLENKKFGLLTVIKRNGSSLSANGARNSLWLCRCECGTFKNVKGCNLVSGKVSSCGCLISKGEYEIRQYLNEKSVVFDTQYKFKDLLSKNKRALSFDFALLNNKKELMCLIEYQGIQHYNENCGYFGEQQRTVTDMLKKEYCSKNNILFFEISYMDNIQNFLDLIIEQLKEKDIFYY